MLVLDLRVRRSARRHRAAFEEPWQLQILKKKKSRLIFSIEPIENLSSGSGADFTQITEMSKNYSLIP